MLIFFKIIISTVLVIGIINPQMAWRITEGWKYKNVEPSAVYLFINRIAAIFGLIIIWFVFPN